MINQVDLYGSSILELLGVLTPVINSDPALCRDMLLNFKQMRNSNNTEEPTVTITSFYSCCGLVSTLVYFVLLWSTPQPKATWEEEKDWFHLAGYIQSIIFRNHNRKSVKAGTKADNMEERCLLVCISWLALLLFWYSPGPPKYAPPTVGSALPHWSVIKKIMPHRQAHGIVRWKEYSTVTLLDNSWLFQFDSRS